LNRREMILSRGAAPGENPSKQNVVLRLLERQPEWRSALFRLHELHRARGKKAEADASKYAERYRGRRAVMVFDVVSSRQRRYEETVVPWVAAFESEPAAKSLSALEEFGPSSRYHLRGGESDTMRAVARGLLAFAQDYGQSSDDDTAESWARLVAPLELAPSLDPYVGCVKGIGIGLFSYMRMRAGADALKPDLRVRAALSALGFPVPNGEAALLSLATLLAEELGISRLVLDQLLWAVTPVRAPASRKLAKRR
jgi:hypothetical protein